MRKASRAVAAQSDCPEARAEGVIAANAVVSRWCSFSNCTERVSANKYCVFAFSKTDTTAPAAGGAGARGQRGIWRAKRALTCTVTPRLSTSPARRPAAMPLLGVAAVLTAVAAGVLVNG